MKPEMILKADVLDIIFEDRNKEYGAYTLRRDYNQRLGWALSGMLAIVALFAFIQNWKSGKMGNTQFALNGLKDSIVLTTYEIPEPPKEIEPPKKKAATIQYTTPVMVAKTETPPPEIKDLDKDVLIGKENIDGPPASQVAVNTTGDEDGKGAAPVAPAEEAPAIYEKSEIQPAFPGGDAALIRFLHKNLRFDFDEMEPGTRMEIRCRFVVDKEGKVNGIDIVRSAGRKGFDEEVIRVVGKMPQWQPGIQNGKKVNVYFTLPVIVQVPQD